MPASIININNVTIIQGDGQGCFRHKIQKCVLAGDSRHFYKKEMGARSIASLEVVAQEFFRLIYPIQPETRIAVNPGLNTYFILSSEVNGYRPLPSASPMALNENEKIYQGLGRVMLVSVFLQETDLKNGNICLNKDNQVIKIDGDWCFTLFRGVNHSQEKRELTLELIASLPYPLGYTSFNWLDMSVGGFTYRTSRMLNFDLSNQTHFRDEINESMLQLLLLPDSYIQHFVDAYVPVSAKADVYIKYLSARREELKRTALQDNSFISYLKTRKAKEVLNQHLLHMKGFIANGHYPLVEVSEYEALDAAVWSQYDSLLVKPALEPESLSVFERLQRLDIDFTGRATKKLMSTFRDLSLNKINKYVELFSNSPENAHKEQKTQFMRLVDEKKGQIQDRSLQLEMRLNELEQLGLDKHIELFEKKQKKMFRKSFYNSEYVAAAQAAQSLCTSLHQARNSFLFSDKPLAQRKKELKEHCLFAVKASRHTLDFHREWFGKLNKFLIDVLADLTLGLSTRLGLFGKTDSAVKLDNFEQIVIKTFN